MFTTSLFPFRITILLLTAVGLTACGSLGLQGSIDYKSSAPVKDIPLEVPPDLSQLTRDSRYTIPGGGSVSASTLHSTQSALGTDRQVVATDRVQDVQLERLGNQRWLRVNRPPEMLWNQVKEFWIKTGFTLVNDNPSLGLIETEWAENRAKIPLDFIRRTLGRALDTLYSTGERDKYRIQIERVNDNTSDIYISHRGMVEVYAAEDKSSTRWQPRPADPTLESEMLRRLMIHLGGTEDRAAVQTAIQTNAVTGLVTWNPGQDHMMYADRFDVAWRRTSVALDRIGFTVEDRDRKAGIFYVRYVDSTEPAKAPGFFARWFGPGTDSTAPFRMKILVQAETPTSSRISIQIEPGQPESKNMLQKITRLIHDELK